MKQSTTPRVVNIGTASYFDDNIHNNKNNSTTNNSNNVVVIRPSIYLKFLYVIFGLVKRDNRPSTGFKLKIV